MALSRRRFGLEDARRVDEDELARSLDGDAANGNARRLHLARHDRDLGADEGIDERRLAGVRRADDRHDAAAPSGAFGIGSLAVSQPWSPSPMTPSRSRSAVAAACSAARFEAPSPRAGCLALYAHLGGEEWCVIGTRALDLDVVRQRETLALRPFLQSRLGIDGGLGVRLALALPQGGARRRAPC